MRRFMMKNLDLTHLYRLSFRFSNKRSNEGQVNGQEEEEKERDSKPEMSDFDKANYAEIQKQTRDTNQPFVVQKRDQEGSLDERKKRLNLKQLELIKNDEYFTDDASLNRPKGIMDFYDNRLALKPGNLYLIERPSYNHQYP